MQPEQPEHPPRYDRPLTLEELEALPDEAIDFSDLPEVTDFSGAFVVRSMDELLEWLEERDGN
jgi:hypothetical protein